MTAPAASITGRAPPRRALIIACGALVREIQAVLGQSRLRAIDLRALPAGLHNRPREIAPAVARLGPPLDFVPRPPPPAWEDHLATFMRWHAAYMALDLVKVVLLATVAGVAARRLRAG